jgi:hypothetical protein
MPLFLDGGENLPSSWSHSRDSSLPSSSRPCNCRQVFFNVIVCTYCCNSKPSKLHAKARAGNAALACGNG